MRKYTELSHFNRAVARQRVDEKPEGFNALELAAVNELQLFYLFTKLSGATDGDYRKLIVLTPSGTLNPNIIMDEPADRMSLHNVKDLIIL